MDKISNWVIFLSNKADKSLLIKQLLQKQIAEIFEKLYPGEGQLFSGIAINQLIEEEEQHDCVEVDISGNRHLRFLSGGEQKKALLNYLLLKEAGYLIVDNPMDNLDMASQHVFRLKLEEVSLHTPIIQLVNRVEDILPFIKNILGVDDDNIFTYYKDVSHFLQCRQTISYLPVFGFMPISDNKYAIESNPLIAFKNVTVQYEERVIVKDICWQINAGEFWQLIGPNGSGKTTLLSLITGDNVKAYGQDLILFGKRKGSGESVWSIKQKIGYFTSAMTDLFGRKTTVVQMIVSGFFDSIGLYIKPSERQLKLADEWLQMIGMINQKQTTFYTLSLGQQRMIMIVRAMVKHPPLLILDEPSAGLDESNVAIVTALINKIAANKSTAILYVSHRKEKHLSPEFIFELIPHKNGSAGKTLLIKHF